MLCLHVLYGISYESLVQTIGEVRKKGREKTGQMELVRFVLEGLQLLVFSLVTHFSIKEWGRCETYACLH